MKDNVLETIKAPVGWINKAAGFLKEVRIQVKKIKWPSPKEALRYTVVVLISSVLLAFFLGGVDFAFSTILREVILK